MRKHSVFAVERKILGFLAPVFSIPFQLLWIAMVVFSVAGFVNPLSLVTWLGLGIAVAGSAVLLLAKWPQVKKLDLFTFGSSGLPEMNRRLYLISYGLLALGLVTILSTHFQNFLTL